MRHYTLLLVVISLLVSTTASAQDMADGMRSNGKIYVVVLVLATIFAGIIAFLIYLDRKIARLEKSSDLKYSALTFLFKTINQTKPYGRNNYCYIRSTAL